MNNEEARHASYNRRLCACLCQNCHTGANNAHNPKTAITLLAKNVHRYSVAAVEEAFEAAQDAAHSHLDIDLAAAIALAKTGEISDAG